MLAHPDQYPIEDGALDKWLNSISLPTLFGKMQQYPRLVADIQASGGWSFNDFRSLRVSVLVRKHMSKYYNAKKRRVCVAQDYGWFTVRKGNKRTQRHVGYKLNKLLFCSVQVERTRLQYNQHLVVLAHLQQTNSQMHKRYQRLHYDPIVELEERFIDMNDFEVEGNGLSELLVPPFAFFEAYRFFVMQMREAMEYFHERYDMPVLEANVLSIGNL